MTRKVLPQHLKRYKVVSKNYASNWTNKRVDGTFKKSKRGKYNANGRFIDDLWFASKAEGDRYEQLKELVKQGKIVDLECQPSYRLVVANQLIATYRADFRYRKVMTGFGKAIMVEDVKGMETDGFRLKMKLMAALHPTVRVTEIPADTIPRCRYLTADETTIITEEYHEQLAARALHRIGAKGQPDRGDDESGGGSQGAGEAAAPGLATT